MGPRRVPSFFVYEMTFVAPSTRTNYLVTIWWTGDNGKMYYSDYWAILQLDGRVEETLPIMEIDITPYMQHINWDLFEGDGHDEVSLVGSVNKRLSGKRKRAKDDENGPEAKKLQQGTSLIRDEELRRKLQYPKEGPSRWKSHDKEIEVIDLTTSDSETDEDDDFNNEDNEDSFIDDGDEEDFEDHDDNEPNINAFLMEIRTDPIYNTRSRALSKWDPKYWHGF